MRVISGSTYDFVYPDALVLDGPDIFVAGDGGPSGQGCVTELDASKGTLVRVLSDPDYRFSGPNAMVLGPKDLYVLNNVGRSVTEVPAGTVGGR